MDFDISFVLLLATVVTGAIWAGYALWCRGRVVERRPIVVDYSVSIFPVVLVVLIIRSFLFEPFRIPSGSMMPTLYSGDFILVEKFAYGLRFPVFNFRVVETGQPQRGDIVVFRYPKDPRVDYIKRIIGLPGDRVVYRDKQLSVNGQPVTQERMGSYATFRGGSRLFGTALYSEQLADVRHDILIEERQHGTDVELVVPPGHYFVMGDNRDNSNDSRFWGTVPERNLVGKAVLIWMSWDWDNGGILFDRLGKRLK